VKSTTVTIAGASARLAGGDLSHADLMPSPALDAVPALDELALDRWADDGGFVPDPYREGEDTYV